MRCLYVPTLFAILFFTVSTLQAQCPTIDAGEDLYLCFPPGPANLNGSIDGPYLDFMWTPTTGLAGTQTLTPTVLTTQNAIYVLKVRGVDLGNNLIQNGDFESGNSNFWSEYLYSPGDLWPEGVYDVLPNPQTAHANFAPCTDHTSGSGNMMAVNGAGAPNLNVWCQTVPVMPNTDYAFSAWVTTLVSSSPALLQFSINGSTIGPIFGAPASTCTWANFYTTWNSGANSSATICIVNQNTVLGGNDFGLDDIVFSPICVVTDTVRVNIINIQATASPAISTIPCEGATITLSGVGSSTGQDISYFWETANGNIVSGETTLNPVVNAAGTYTLTVTYNNGVAECTKTATVSVIESPNPLFAWIDQPNPIGCGSSTSLLIGHSSQSAFSSYQWTAGPGGNFTSGTTGPTATVDQPGDYTLLVTNTMTGCTAEATATVIAATNPPAAEAASDVSVFNCATSTATLDGAGSSTGNNIAYAWTAFNGGNITAGANTMTASADAPGSYVLTVTNTTNGCTASDTLVIIANNILPEVTIQPPGVFTCNTDTLLLSGSVNTANVTTEWIPGAGGALASDSSQLSVNILSPGIYILSALDTTNFCLGSDTIVVGIDTLPPLVAILAPDTITCQTPNITLSGTGSSAGPNFNYLWTTGNGGNIVSGDTTLNPGVNAPGAYTLLVTNTTTGCQADSAVLVVADADALVAVANAPDTLTCADTLVVLNANGSSTIPGLIYVWTTTNGQIAGGGDSPTPTVAATGTYQLLLTNPANGCTATDDIDVQENTAAPGLSIEAPDTLTCANPSLSLQGQNNGPGTSFEYLWTTGNGGNIVSGNTTLNPEVNAPGNYTLTATNLLTGCTATTSVTVALEAGTPVAIATVPGPIDCSNPTQTLNTGGSSTGPGFDFSWSTTDGNFTGGQNSPSPTVDAPGTYALTVTNLSNGCTATTVLTVLEDTALPPADAGPDGLLTCTAAVFSLSANNGQADPVLLFSWETTGGGFSGNPDSITVGTTLPGMYILTVLNSQNGCVSTDTVQVDANQVPPDVTIPTPETLTCVLTSSTLNALGGNPNFSYAWSTANGQFVSGQNSAAPVVDAPGTYTLLVTDTVNGCTGTFMTTVPEDIAIPQADAGPAPTLTCAQPQAVLQGTVEPGPGISILWTSANGNIVSGENTASPVVDQPGDYQLLVTNTGNGCTNMVAVAVQQNTTTPTANAGPDATLSCSLNSLKLSGSGSGGGATFNWTAANGGNIVSGSTTLNPTIDAPGTYILLVTDPVNGCTATDSVVVANDATAPMATAGNPGSLTCAVTQLNLQGNGSVGANFTHNWTAAPGGNIVSGANTLSPVVNAPGVYTLTITNLTNGCTATATSTVGQNITPPAVQIAAPNVLTCTVQSTSLSGSPTGANFSYFWQTTGGAIVSGGATPTPIISQPGTYTLRVTNQTNGCTATASVAVVADKMPPVLSIATPQTLTCANPTASLSGSVSQPATGFSSVWTTIDGQLISGQNSLAPVVGAPGNYVLTVQNLQNGCTASAAVLVNQNITPPVADAGPAPTITCASPQVALDGTASSGQGPLTFSWSGGLISSGQNSPAPTVTEAAGYTLLVTDAANGCTAIASVTVLENTTPPDVLIAPPLVRTCLRDTVVLDAGASSNGPGYSFNWTTADGQFSSGQNSLTPLVQAAGIYVLTIQNQQNGCSSTASVSVLEDLAAPNADAGPGDELHCNNAETTLQGSSTTPAALSFAWVATSGGNILSGANSANPTVNSAGAYLLTVTNTGNGCTATDAVTVTEVPPPVFTPEVIQPDCHQATGSIAIGAITGGVAPFRYSRDGGQQFQPSPNFSGLAPGAYTLVVQDAYNCAAAIDVAILPPFVPELTLSVGPVLELGDSLQLEPVLNMPYSQVASWQWTPADGLSCTDCPSPWARPFRPTIYRLQITDLNGCTAEADVVVQVDRRRNLYAPTIFSPNGDGENDRFLLFGRGVAEIQTLRIFDRWGNQLFLNEHFQPNDENEGWDGRYRGQDMNPAVFIWQAVIRFVDGAVEVYAGDVTLYR